MQNIFISHNSALNFYRNARANNILEIVNNKGNNILGSNIYTPEVNKWTLSETNVSLSTDQSLKVADIVKNSIPYIGNDKYIDVLINNKSKQNKTKKVRYHLQSKDLPPFSFLKVTNGIYVINPELLFLQMACVLPFYKLFLLGLEICGNYSMDKSGISGFIPNVFPLTTSDRILRYLNRIKKSNKYTPGIKTALDVAKYLENNSASPQESRLYIMLAAPHKYGGYGVKNLKLNQKIQLSNKAKDILGYECIKPDISIKSSKIAIEYDSTAYHENTRQNNHDKLRQDALHIDKWHLISFVPAVMKNIYTFHTLALQILSLNKQSKRINTKDFDIKRQQLWKALNLEYIKPQQIII